MAGDPLISTEVAALILADNLCHGGVPLLPVPDWPLLRHLAPLVPDAAAMLSEEPGLPVAQVVEHGLQARQRPHRLFVLLSDDASRGEAVLALGRAMGDLPRLNSWTLEIARDETLPPALRAGVALRVWEGVETLEGLLQQPETRAGAVTALANYAEVAGAEAARLVPYLDLLEGAGVPAETRISLAVRSATKIEFAEAHLRRLHESPATRPAVLQGLVSSWATTPAALFLVANHHGTPAWLRLYFLDRALRAWGPEAVAAGWSAFTDSTLSGPVRLAARFYGEPPHPTGNLGWSAVLLADPEAPDPVGRALSALWVVGASERAREVLLRAWQDQPDDVGPVIRQALQEKHGRALVELIEFAMPQPDFREAGLQAMFRLLSGNVESELEVSAERVARWVAPTLEDPHLRDSVLEGLRNCVDASGFGEGRVLAAAVLSRGPGLAPGERALRAVVALQGRRSPRGSVRVLLDLLQDPEARRAVGSMDRPERCSHHAFDWTSEDRCAFLSSGLVPGRWRAKVAAMFLDQHPRVAREALEQVRSHDPEGVLEVLFEELGRSPTVGRLLEEWLPEDVQGEARSRLACFRLRDPSTRPVARATLTSLLSGETTREAALKALRWGAHRGSTAAQGILMAQGQDTWDLSSAADVVDPLELVPMLRLVSRGSPLERQVRACIEQFCSGCEGSDETEAAMALVLLCAAGHLDLEDTVRTALRILDRWNEYPFVLNILTGLLAALLASPGGPRVRALLREANWSTPYRLGGVMGSLLLHDVGASPEERLEAAVRALEMDTSYTEDTFADQMVGLMQRDPAGPSLVDLFMERTILRPPDAAFDARTWIVANDERRSPKERARALVAASRPAVRQGHDTWLRGSIVRLRRSLFRTPELRDPLLHAIQEELLDQGGLKAVGARLLTDPGLEDLDRENLLQSLFNAPGVFNAQGPLDATIRKLASQFWSRNATLRVLKNECQRLNSSADVSLLLAEVGGLPAAQIPDLALGLALEQSFRGDRERPIFHLLVALGTPDTRASTASKIREAVSRTGRFAPRALLGRLLESAGYDPPE